MVSYCTYWFCPFIYAWCYHCLLFDIVSVWVCLVIVPCNPAVVIWARRRLPISISCCFSLLRRAIQDAACFSLLRRRGMLLRAPWTFSNRPNACCCRKYRFSSWSCCINALCKEDKMKLEETGLLQQLIQCFATEWLGNLPIIRLPFLTGAMLYNTEIQLKGIRPLHTSGPDDHLDGIDRSTSTSLLISLSVPVLWYWREQSLYVPLCPPASSKQRFWHISLETDHLRKKTNKNDIPTEMKISVIRWNYMLNYVCLLNSQYLL